MIFFVGMIPHKTQRGKDALRRLKAYEGCPPPYDRRKCMVVPGAMRIICLKAGRKVFIILSVNNLFIYNYFHYDGHGNLRLNIIC